MPALKKLPKSPSLKTGTSTGRGKGNWGQREIGLPSPPFRKGNSEQTKLLNKAKRYNKGQPLMLHKGRVHIAQKSNGRYVPRELASMGNSTNIIRTPKKQPLIERLLFGKLNEKQLQKNLEKNIAYFTAKPKGKSNTKFGEPRLVFDSYGKPTIGFYDSKKKKR